MALQDHFHPPLSTHRHWQAFHNAWATYIASDLNHRLPENYFAEPNVQFGIEIDVATFEESLPENVSSLQKNSLKWKPPAPTQSFPFQPVSEAVEISIFNNEEGPLLAGAIELVSPANKDRPASRKAFVSKCEAYLQQSLGLIIIDVVTVRQANLHNELLENIVASDVQHINTHLYTTAYQVVKHHKEPRLDIWQQSLEVGQPLPTMPLWLRGPICLPIDLGATYELTCQEQRIKVANGLRQK
ncbi:hypothetical protein PN36_10765 [Candidatus Thiomargarita nelsonii]|uniref:DUF4058 domain-containing protein n=1 Tax=Candidatus Thiomargarita nelsonii TaxID=1003181 RepID=A0A0A6PIM3_9GAMM|nr:hypothetical protein PN36_10765 [Candidatus Thiomargarita nelsonii]